MAETVKHGNEKHKLIDRPKLVGATVFGQRPIGLFKVEQRAHQKHRGYSVLVGQNTTLARRPNRVMLSSAGLSKGL